MKRTWSPDELAARWTLTDAERQPLPGRVDQNRLRFALSIHSGPELGRAEIIAGCKTACAPPSWRW